MLKKNKKKFGLIMLSLFLIQLFLVNTNMLNALGYQTDEDLATTINAELNSNTLELKGNSLMTTGTHAFYDTPELDIGAFEHDITSINVLNVQSPSYTTSNSDDFQITDPVFYSNETLFLNESVDEYTCDGGLDTVIGLNINYASNDNDVIEIFNDDFTGDQWSLYDMGSTTITYAKYLDEDSYVDANYPTSNYGSATTMHIWTGTWPLYGFIKSDIEYLYESKASNSILAINTYNGYNVLTITTCGTFNEGSITWNNKPGAISTAQSGYGVNDGWNYIPLTIVYPYYRITGQSYVNTFIYSSESSYKPYITHYLNKFYQNTGSGYFYMQTATDQDMLNVKSPLYANTTCITAGDHILLDCQTTSSEQLVLKLWKDGVVVKEYIIFNYGNSNYARHEVDIPVDEYTEFDQMSINGKFDNAEYFKCWGLSVEEHVGKNFFSGAYVHDFSYEVLGQNYTEDFTLILDEDNSEHTSSEGTYAYYFDSSMFSNRGENDDVIIHSQALNFTLTMNIERDVNLTVNASYSSNSWVVPSVVGLKINGEEVSDESTNSGYCALSEFPETLTITSTSKVYFRLEITSLFSFTFDLDVISKTYLRKSFQLISNHDINITSIILPETLWIKKIYLNNYDYGDENSLTLNPKVEMATSSIFKLEVITQENVYLPLDQDLEGGYYIVYSENFGTNTGEMYHSYLFSDYDHDFSVNGNLYMQNEIPSEIYPENWSDWTLDYNSSYTGSNFNNGTLSSNVTTSSNETPELNDFTVNEGSLVENSSTHVYSATYSFTDDAIGSIPSGWTKVGAEGSDYVVEVQNELDSHGKIVNISDASGAGYAGMGNTFSSQENGTIEFYLWCSDTTKTFQIALLPVSLVPQVDNGYLQYYDGSWHDIISISDDTWYHVRIDFECGSNNYEGLSPDTFYIYVNGVQYGPYGYFIGVSSISTLKLTTTTSDSSYHACIDAIGYSWDPGYKIGENLNPNSNLANLSTIDGDYMTFNSTQAYNYPGTYSFDGLSGNPFYESVVGSNSYSDIVDYNYHKDVLGLYDNDASGYIYTQISGMVTYYGTLEFWTCYDGSYGLLMWGSRSGVNMFNLKIESNILKAINDTTWESLATLTEGKWYHIRIDFESTTGNYMGLSQYTYDVYLDGANKGNFIYQNGNGVTYLSLIGISTSQAQIHNLYLDAIGFSWDPSYNIGDNYHWKCPSLNITITQHIDLQIIGDLSLFYSLNATYALNITLSLYNFETGVFDVMNSSLQLDFVMEMSELNSSYFNESNYIIANLIGTNETRDSLEFQLFLEAFSLYVGIERDAILSKNVELETDFDGSKYDAYQKLFNISIELHYRFIVDNATFSYHAFFNETELNTSGEWVDLQFDFIFNTTDPSDPDYFPLYFNISNGMLEMSSMSYTIEFKCINLNDQYQLYQYFKLSPEFSITSNDITQEVIYLNFTFDFTPTTFLDLDYNNSISNDIFLYRVNIQGESGWMYQDLGVNSTTSDSPSLNLTSILQDNNQTSFQDVYIEFYLSGIGSSITIDTLNISILTDKIQLTGTPRTDIDSVEFQEPMLATRSYSYWYFENSYLINDVSLEDVETSGTVSSFNINDSKYFFVKSFYSDDLILGLLDYDPNWDISYEVLTNNGTYTRMRIDYKADFSISNVSIVLNLKNDGILNDNWTLGTQDSYTFKLAIPSISFTSTKQSFYIEGYSTIPYAVMSSYESDQNWNRIVINSEINYAGYLTYPKYTQVFLLTKETDWTAYSVYYGDSIFSAETMNPTLVKVLGDGFDPDVDDSYLYFRTSPFKSVDFNFDGATITITINCSIDVENAYFLYTFDPSGVHNLALQSSNNSISIQDLTDSGDFDGYLYFATAKIYSGITQIRILVNFVTPVEMIVQSIIIFIILGIAVAGYYYIKRNEEKVEKLSKKIGKKLKEKLNRRKKEKGVKEISLKIQDNKLYLEDKR